MNQVPADSMSPTHMAPFVAKGIVLIEQVVFSLMIDHPVRIVHPVSLWREMKLRTERLSIKWMQPRLRY
jgi:hypothetical protein